MSQQIATLILNIPQNHNVPSLVPGGDPSCKSSSSVFHDNWSGIFVLLMSGWSNIQKIMYLNIVKVTLLISKFWDLEVRICCQKTNKNKTAHKKEFSSFHHLCRRSPSVNNKEKETDIESLKDPDSVLSSPLSPYKEGEALQSWGSWGSWWCFCSRFVCGV